MGQPARLLPPIERAPLRLLPPAGPPLRFESLVLTRPSSRAGSRSATLFVSVALHAILIAAVLIVPLFWDDVLPAPQAGVRAFFASPPEVVAAPPPPPPPPAAGPRPVSRVPAVAPRPDAGRLVAPVELPEAIEPEETLDMGVEGGTPGGVEGGVPGGVIGGVVGGLPTATPAPAPPRVRIGGLITAPRLLREVKPEYPLVAAQARIHALVILEAEVGVDGFVKSVRVMRGHPLFDEAAVAAVRQWRYRPLLLNGVPVEFVLTVTINFNVAAPAPVRP